jgi:hypothetical protein
MSIVIIKIESLEKGRVDQAMSMRKLSNKLRSQVQSELIGKKRSVEEWRKKRKKMLMRNSLSVGQLIVNDSRYIAAEEAEN